MNQATESASPSTTASWPVASRKSRIHLMLFLDVVAPPFQIFIAMIGRRVAQGRQRVGVRPVGRRVQDPVEFPAQLESTRNR